MANKKLSAIISIGGAVAGTLIGSIDKTKGKIGEIGQSLKNLERQQERLGRTIRTFGSEGKNVDGMRQRYQALTKEIEKQRKELEKVQKLEANREKQSKLGAGLAKTAAVGVAIAAPAALTFKNSADYNYGLQVIGNTANMSREAIVKMGKEIINTSEKVGQTSDNVKDAVGFLVAAGDEADAAMKKIDAIGKTATASDAQILDVAKASFTLQNSLKIEPEKMARALEMLVQAGKEGNFEFKAMAAELPVLGASFQALKFTGDEAVASMGAYMQLAQMGAATSSEAATNMGNFLQKILMPETLKKAEKLGSDLNDVVTKAQKAGANPIEAAVKEISRITKGGDQKLLGELFQDSEVQKFLRPVLQNMEKYEKMKANILSSKNVVDKDFADMMSTSKKQMEMLDIASDNLSKTVGNALEPAFGKVAAVLTPLVVSMRQFAETNPELVSGVTLVGGALIALTGTVIAARIAWVALSTTMMGQAALSGLAMVGTGIRAIGTAFLFAGRALLMNPIGLTITALAGAAYLLMTNWEPVKAFFIDLWDGVKAAFDKAIGYIMEKLESMLGKVQSAVGWLNNVGAKIGSGVYDGVQATKKFFGGGDIQNPVFENATPGPAAPPPMAGARKGGTTITDSSQNTFHIYQQPGQDPKDLAEALTREQERRRQIMKRGTMFDGVMAQ